MTMESTTLARPFPESSVDLGPAALLGLFREMLRSRLVEEEIAAIYPIEEQEMRCPIHLSVGQEAVAVGVSAVLRREDQVVSNHRWRKGGFTPFFLLT